MKRQIPTLGDMVMILKCDEGFDHKDMVGEVLNVWDNGDVDVNLPDTVCFATEYKLWEKL